MSYILDALRRADAERQRGQVPGLDARPMAGVLTEPRPHALGDGRRLAGLALLLAALALAAAAGWWWRSTPGQAAPTSPPQGRGLLPPAPSDAMPAAPGRPLPALPPAPPRPAPAGLAPEPLARPGAVAAPAPGVRPVPLALPASAAPALTGASAPAAPPGSVGAAPAGGALSNPATQAPSAPSAQDNGPRSLLAWADLPEPARREIGNLAVSGAMHGEQASLRMVVLNGQVLREGDRLTPDLQVQQIRLKSVVLSHRGQRFELPF